MPDDLAALLHGEVKAFKPSNPWLMNFERQFMKTPGASMGPAQCYETKQLHASNFHVIQALREINERKNPTL